MELIAISPTAKALSVESAWVIVLGPNPLTLRVGAVTVLATLKSMIKLIPLAHEVTAVVGVPI